MPGLCQHGAIKDYCDLCNEVLDNYWDERRDRRWDAKDRFVANPYLYKEEVPVSPPTYSSPSNPQPSEHDYQLAREMLRVAGSPTAATSPQEAYERAVMVMHTAHRTGGVTLREFEAMRKQRDEEDKLRQQHKIGLPTSGKKKVRRKKKKATVVEPEPDPAPEPPPPVEEQVAAPTDAPKAELTNEEQQFLEGLVENEASQPAVPRYHVKGRPVSGVGARVFTVLTDPAPGTMRPPPVTVDINSDFVEGRDAVKQRYPPAVVVRTVEHPEGYKLDLDRVPLKCTCGSAINQVYTPPAEREDPNWACASCGTLDSKLTPPSSYWGCPTADTCSYGFCNDCYNIPVLKNGLPTWSAPYDPLTDAYSPPTPEPVQKETEPKGEAKPPKKKSKKKDASGKGKKKVDAKDKEGTEKGKEKDKEVKDKKEKEDVKAKEEKEREKGKTPDDEDAPAPDEMLHSASLLRKKKKKTTGNSDPVYATRQDGKTLYSTSDGHWRVGTKSDALSGRIPKGGTGADPSVESIVRIKLDMYNGRPEKIAEAQSRYGVTEDMVPKAVLGGDGVYTRIDLKDGQTPDDVTHELLETVQMTITTSMANPTGRCYCGGAIELVFGSLTTKHCDMCGMLVSRVGYGFCSSCAYTACTECTRRDDDVHVLEVARTGTQGLGGVYFLEGTNIIGMVEYDSPASARDIKRGMSVVAMNGTPVTTDGDAIDILREAYTAPLELSVIYHSAGRTMMTSAKHDGQLPHQMGMGWRRKGRAANALCGVAVYDPTILKPEPVVEKPSEETKEDEKEKDEKPKEDAGKKKKKKKKKTEEEPKKTPEPPPDPLDDSLGPPVDPLDSSLGPPVEEPGEKDKDKEEDEGKKKKKKKDGTDTEDTDAEKQNSEKKKKKKKDDEGAEADKDNEKKGDAEAKPEADSVEKGKDEKKRSKKKKEGEDKEKKDKETKGEEEKDETKNKKKKSKKKEADGDEEKDDKKKKGKNKEGGGGKDEAKDKTKKSKDKEADGKEEKDDKKKSKKKEGDGEEEKDDKKKKGKGKEADGEEEADDKKKSKKEPAKEENDETKSKKKKGKGDEEKEDAKDEKKKNKGKKKEGEDGAAKKEDDATKDADKKKSEKKKKSDKDKDKTVVKDMKKTGDGKPPKPDGPPPG